MPKVETVLYKRLETKSSPVLLISAAQEENLAAFESKKRSRTSKTQAGADGNPLAGALKSYTTFTSATTVDPGKSVDEI